MAYTSDALGVLLRRKRQYEATGGSLTSAETEGLTRGVLSVEAERKLQALRIAKQTALEKRRLGLYGEQIATERELGERRLSMEEEQAKDQETAGYIQSGLSLLGSKAGYEGVKWVGSKIFPSAATPTGGALAGISGGTGPYLETGVPTATTTAPTTFYASPALQTGAGAVAPAITGAGAAAPAALGGAGMPTVAGTSIPAWGEAGALAVPSAEAAGVGGFGATGGAVGTEAGATAGTAGAGTAGGLSLGAIAAPVAVGAIGGAIGSYASKSQIFREISPFGGRRTESAFGGAMGGAAMGAMVGGPVGAVVGGVIGLTIGAFGGGPNPVWETEKQYDEYYEKTKGQLKSQYGEIEGGNMYHAWKYGGTYSGPAGTQTFPQGGMKNEEDKAKNKQKEDEGTVICTELHRQKFITTKTLKVIAKYKKDNVDKETYAGYMKWAPQFVNLMQKSKLITLIVKPFGVGWINEMAHRVKPEYKGSLLGRIVLDIGVPLCRRLGKEEKNGIRASFGNGSPSSVK